MLVFAHSVYKSAAVLAKYELNVANDPQVLIAVPTEWTDILVWSRDNYRNYTIIRNRAIKATW